MNVSDLQNYNINIGLNTNLINTQNQEIKQQDNKKSSVEKDSTSINNIANVQISKLKDNNFSIDSLTYQNFQSNNENLNKEKNLLNQVKKDLNNLKNNLTKEDKMEIQSNISTQLNSVQKNNSNDSKIKEIQSKLQSTNMSNDEIELTMKNINDFSKDNEINIDNLKKNTSMYLQSKSNSNLSFDYSKDSENFFKENLLSLTGSLKNSQSNLSQDYVKSLLS